MTLAPVRRLPETQVRYAICSNREIEVVQELLRDGAGNRAIGKRLFITEETVKSHLRTIYSKTDTDNRSELIVSIMRGWVVVVDSRVNVVRF